MKSLRPSRALLLASVGLYLVSLTLNAFCAVTGGTERCDDSLGVGVLALGWMELIAIGDVGPFVALPWFANPCLFAAWVFVLGRARKIALALAALGALLGLSFLLGHSVQISEGAGPSPITGYLAGYWVWLGSLFLALLSALWTPSYEPPAGAPEPPGLAGSSGDRAQDATGSSAGTARVSASAGTTAVRVRASST